MGLISLSLQAEVLGVDSFQRQQQGVAWGEGTSGPGWKGPWTESVFQIQEGWGGYFGPFGKEGNDDTERPFSRPVSMDAAKPVTLWGSMVFEVKTRSSDKTSISQLLLGPDDLKESVSILGIASGQTNVDNPVSDTLWAVRTSRRRDPAVVVNRNAREPTRWVWRLTLDPKNGNRLDAWLDPENVTNESALGAPLLSLQRFTWEGNELRKLSIRNNGQSRFRIRDLVVATRFQDIQRYLVWK